MTTNPFAVEAEIARQAENTLRQKREAAKAEKATFELGRREAIEREKKIAEAKATIKTMIARFKPELVTALKKEFVLHPKTRKPHQWNGEQIIEAGEYVNYLTTPFIKTAQPVQPKIDEVYAGVIRDRFVWSLFMTNHYSKATLPDNTFVGQLEPWFDELVAEKQSQFDRFLESKRPAKPAPTPEPVEEAVDADKQGDENDEVTEVRELTDEDFRGLVDRFKAAPVRKVGPAITPKGANRKTKKLPIRTKVDA